MIDILNHCGRVWVEYFGAAVVQNTLFLGLIFLVLYQLRNTRANVKYSIAMVGLVKLLIPPFLRSNFVVMSPGAPAPVSGFTSTVTFAPFPAGSAALRPSPVQLDLFGLLFTLWAGFALLYLVYSLVSTLRLTFILRNATRITDGSTLKVVGDRKIGVYKSDRINMPSTFGIFPRKIFVPGVWDRWTGDCRTMVIRHEMAHIHRYDGLFQVLQILTRALYFFHPLVMLLNGRLKEYREMACDDESIGCGRSSSVQYSRYLVEIAEAMVKNPVTCESASALIRRKNELLNRVRYQMKGADMRTLSKKKTGILLAGMIMLLLTLSWYHSGAAPEGRSDPAPGKGINSTLNGKPAGSNPEVSETRKGPKVIRISVKGDKEIEIDGKTVSLNDLTENVKEKIGDDIDAFMVDMICEKDVEMSLIYDVQGKLRDMDLLKINYMCCDTDDGTPLVLPDKDLEYKIKEIPEENIVHLLVKTSGEVLLDGEQVEASKINEVIRQRLSENDKLIITIRTADGSEYKHFLVTLQQVKMGGAKRIRIDFPQARGE